MPWPLGKPGPKLQKQQGQRPSARPFRIKHHGRQRGQHPVFSIAAEVEDVATVSR
eukprot:NODE_10480_length_305_cov_1.140000.p3 GENE.NODE_10480_length_305_cov_1.140000~~NODE_10480_length_305_cov_1.140000.p3  ORF type:complete len:55 (-),score=2.88 NODE_10480_length_305_cov_1.140000:140-304(-)